MKPIIIDFETYYSKEYSLSKMTTQTYILDERFKVHGAGIKVGDAAPKWITAKYLPAVFKALDLEHNILIGHNLHFDGAILAWHYGIIPAMYIDTLPMSHALIGCKSPRHGLTYIAKLLCGLEKYEGFLAESLGVRDLSPELEHRVGDIYCAGPINGNKAGDVMLTYEILKKMLPFISREELNYIDWTIRIFTQPKVYLDTDMLREYNRDVKESKEKALASVGLDTRETLMSNPKFATALEALGAMVPTKQNAKGVTVPAFAKTDEGFKALLEHDNPDVQAIVAARLEVKSTIEETRSQRYLEASVLGAWPVHINASGAQNTHRASGGMGGGGNPQNMKRGGMLRNCIYAPEGNIFAVPDLSQIEARITLWLGSLMPEAHMEQEALDKLRAGEDIYSWFGSHIYDMPINKKDHPLERQIAKSAVLGLGFGMGKDRFVDYCKTAGIKSMTPELADRIKVLYRSMFRGVTQFWNICQNVILPAMAGGNPLDLGEVLNELISIDKDPLFNSPSIKLPGGLRIKYPELYREEGRGGQWSYQDGNGRATLFGGKVMENCIGPDSEVLTFAGWKRIIDVTADDLLWDGSTWVPHDGVIEQGEQTTINFGGMHITPDHKVDINGHWITAGSASYEEATASYKRHYRLPYGNVSSY